MAKTISAQAHISYYTAGQLGTPHKTTDIQSIYELIKTDEALRKVSNYIQRKHTKGIEDAFNTIDKKTYQDQKKKYLDAVCFSGNIDRSAGQKPSFHHNGRINLDIDENSKEDLTLFRRLVKSGHFPYIEACGRSISGTINGHLWTNALIEIPEDIQGNYDQLEALHKQYHSAISHALANIVLVDLECTERFQHDQTVIRLSSEELVLLQIKRGHQLSIIVGKSNDVKRVRYITHDADLILHQAKPVLYKDLKKFEGYQEQKRKVNYMEKKTALITASDHFDYCHQFAEQHGYQYEDGQKQNYLARFCIGANLVGIPEEVTRTYVLANIHEREDGDFIRYPYKQYKESFGLWRHKVRISQKTFLPMDVKADTFLQFNKYLEDSADFPKLLNRICHLKRSMLIVPTGSGKTFSTIGAIRERFKAQYSDKTFIFLTPLKAITEQVGIDTDLQMICEGQTSFRSALFEDSICTVKSFVDWSEQLHEEDKLKDVILVFDELHELITASGYQQLGTMPYLFDQVFKCIGLTATPLTPLVSHFGFTPIKCDRIDAPAVNIEYKRITQDQLYKTITSIGKANRTAKTLYFYNDRKGIEKLSKASRRQGLKADFFHAGVKQNKAEAYLHLIEKGTLPEETDHLFSTKILGFGTSFKQLENIVYITNNRTKDFLEFIQAYARLREDQINVTLIIIETKNEQQDKVRLYDFDQDQYNRKLYQLQKTADFFNCFDTEAVKVGIDPLKNNLAPEVNRLVKYNKLTGKYFVDRLQLFNDQYQRITRSISTEDFLQFLTLIPNVHIKTDEQEAVISDADQQIIDQVEEEHKEEERQDIEALKVLLQEKKDQVFKYVHKETEDVKLKEKIKDHLPIMVEKLEGGDQRLIDRRFNLAVNVVRRYIKLTSDYKDRIDPHRIIEYCFLSGYNWSKKLRQLYSLENVERYEADTDIGQASQQDATGKEKLKVSDQHIHLIRFFCDLQGQEFTAGDLLHQVEGQDWYTALNLNRKTWSEEMKMFFHIERRRTNKERLIHIGHRHRLTDLLSGDILGYVPSKRIAV